MQADRTEYVANDSGGGGRLHPALAGILLATVLLRLIHINQPIMENYVGRQVPTAMAARNLERGSGFLRPQLDTAPFPNLFMVEPPVYQVGVVSLRGLSGWPLEACGRALSALAAGLGAWGLFELVRRRDGESTALAAVVAFALFPITIRYGRAFQPDSLMLGAVLAGLAFWDRAEQGGRWWRFVPAWALLAVGLAAKVTSAFVLVPLVWGIMKPPRAGKAVLAAAALGPVLLWYLWANQLAGSAEGSRSLADNRAIWLAVPGVHALGELETLKNVWKFLVVRAFTPLGLVLGVWGLCLLRQGGRTPDVWRLWAGAALPVLALLAAKLHHEYYWLVLAPVAAAGVARVWTSLAAWRHGPAWALFVLLVGSSFLLVRSTWRTPEEWRHIEAAARTIREVVPDRELLVAAEPLLFQADRRGCRLEFTPRSAARAAAEWPTGRDIQVESPLDLIDFYRARGARYVADLAPEAGDQRRIALHDAIRGRYKVLVDDPSVIVAELSLDESPRHGQ